MLSSRGLCTARHLTSTCEVVLSSSPPGEILSSMEQLAMTEEKKQFLVVIIEEVLPASN